MLIKFGVANLTFGKVTKLVNGPIMITAIIIMFIMLFLIWLFDDGESNYAAL